MILKALPRFIVARYCCCIQSLLLKQHPINIGILKTCKHSFWLLMSKMALVVSYMYCPNLMVSSHSHSWLNLFYLLPTFQLTGCTPIVLAARRGQLKLVETLFSNGADVNITDCVCAALICSIIICMWLTENLALGIFYVYLPYNVQCHTIVPYIPNSVVPSHVWFHLFISSWGKTISVNVYQ